MSHENRARVVRKSCLQSKRFNMSHEKRANIICKSCSQELFAKFVCEVRVSTLILTKCVNDLLSFFFQLTF